MQFTTPTILLALASLLSSVSAHGVIVSPTPRTPGTAYEAACGNTIYNNQKADQAGPIQLLMQSASSITDLDACNLWLCKGYQFDDNTANVQTYTPGETIQMQVDIRAPHTGYANVSIVNTKSNSVVGTALKTWESYASTSTGVTADETSFEITVPADLDGCTTAGDCVIQWFWYAPPGVDQTYEGCVDFVVGGSGSTPSSSAPTSTKSTAVPVKTATKSAAVPVYTTTAATIKPTSTSVTKPMYTTTSKAAPVYTTAAPSTLMTKTRTSTTAPATAPAAGATKTSQSINQCLDAVNECIRNAQSARGGAVDFSSCEAQRAACY
ncbi:hypothetical protein BZA05DRAFT_372955 [Tricharina praecox]|uniref:uncharacterized protein n=1 Tax=Tricharina praecox TaxID=43433 RepID=UPI00221F194F|nr:uncharacterized protein BZA05DRAFT_372955 [Tricharina praecox]KAI5852065.1 hypothetical protein BZA05DRAFT_372955 [Tricharina praecox]